MNLGKNSLVLCGGGIDSYVAAWDNHLTQEDDDNPQSTMLLYVDYGSKARKQEIEATEHLRDEMNKRFGARTAVMSIIEFDLWSRYLESPLTSESATINRNPRSGVAHEWVPARNTVLMSVALAIAESCNYARIICGINKTAARAYPDNDIEWLERWCKLAEYSVSKGRRIELLGPVAELTKLEIINHAYHLGMTQEIISHSWSCYEAKIGLHCGKCSSCRARRQAFNESLWSDPTTYAERATK